ncbi:MAG: type II toxin-antitoxin system RelE/ParE family toxin [Patescibacteria group bacterium]
MKVFYTQTAAKQLENLSNENQKRISKKMRFFISQSDPLKFAKHLIGYDLWSFRIGDYRLIFETENGSIRILFIEWRDKIYKKL